MTKRKSIIATSVLATLMCLTLVLCVCLSGTTLVAHAEESKNMPQIVRVGDTEVDQENNMVSLPAGIVGKEYNSGKFVTAGKNDVITMKSAESGEHGHLPSGLVFNAETNEITGTPTEAGTFGVSVFCTNENGYINILAWIRIFSEGQEPKITEKEIPNKAYVGSLYSAKVKVDGYNEYFSIDLTGNVPDGMDAYKVGEYAYIRFTPTSGMAGKIYNFTLCVKNVLGEAIENCTITVANEVEAPEFITETQPLGKTEDNPNGVRPVVGKPFEFWLQASGTNTKDNPLEFFANDSNSTPETMQDEYALGGNLYLTKEGKIYSNNVEAVSGNQISCHIGVRNKNSSGNYTSGNTTTRYCYFTVVDGYEIDEIIITPAETDVPKGGTRQFKVEIKGVGDIPTANWVFYNQQPKDENTTISQNGLLTIGANETCSTLCVGVEAGTKYASATINVIDHTHTTRLVEAVAKTCTTDGNIKHFKCDSCGGMFSDAKAINTLTEEQVVIKASHEYGNLTPEVPATCSATGTEAYYECGVCHKLFDESKNEKTAEQLVIAVDSSAHNYGSMIDEVAATCASEGTKEHKDCLLCGKHFDNTNTEITDLSIEKNDNHDLETVWTKAADGHYHKCKREDCKDGGKVDFAAHTPDRSEATEENAVKCTVCDYIITPALGHTHNLTLVPGTAATCQADGKKAYYTCDGCSEKFEDEAGTIAITADIETWGIIPKAHKFGQWIAEVPATKEATGTKAHKDCEFCGKHFDNDGNEITDLTIAKLPSGGEQGGGEQGGNQNTGNNGGEVIEPKDEGLSGGAIAGIVIGSVAVVGIGGFAIFWFAIRKKSFAELIAAIKGIFKKK